jgi:hypothetical protein
MHTDTKKWARVHSLREWGRVKQKLCQQAYKIFAFFCQSQLAGIIGAHLCPKPVVSSSPTAPRPWVAENSFRRVAWQGGIDLATPRLDAASRRTAFKNACVLFRSLASL